jgi:ribonuclease BN (tRNA processing enzyme)
LQIAVLGKSPAWQDVGGACSGYLIQEAGYTLLLDCGNGVFAKLRAVCDYVDVNAVLITHLHADHYFDLIPYSYALTYAARQQPVPVAGWPGTATPARPQLHAPAGAGDAFARTASVFGPGELIESAFALREYDVAEELELGPFRMRFREVPHYVPTFAVDLVGQAGGRLTFSADCSPNDEIVELARGTDLLLIEATLPRPERTGIRGHLTPREAGEHARRAGARRVMLTHFSDELDRAWVQAEGSAGFGAEVELAAEGLVLSLDRTTAWDGNGDPRGAGMDPALLRAREH